MKTKQIESASNPIYKKLLSLTKNKGVQEHGQCLVSGEKLIKELTQGKPSGAYYIYTDKDHELFSTHPLEQLLLLPKNLFEELNVVGTPGPLLCREVPAILEWNPKGPLPEHELLVALGDPNNLGALLRSARAFGVQNIVLLKEACHPFHPRAVKASAGAVFQLNFFKGPSISALEKMENLIALDAAGESLNDYIFDGKYRILLGEEGQGLPSKLDAELISIPIVKSVESLNATVAASVLLYELSIS